MLEQKDICFVKPNTKDKIFRVRERYRFSPPPDDVMQQRKHLMESLQVVTAKRFVWMFIYDTCCRERSLHRSRTKRFGYLKWLITEDIHHRLSLIFAL